MKKIILFCLLAIISSQLSYSQYSMDFGLNLGSANYLGEIGGSEGEARPFILDIQFQKTSFAFGGFYRVNFTKALALRAFVNYARISGADSLSANPGRVGRNLSFRTDLIELGLAGEVTIFSFNDMSRRSKNRVDFSTFLTLGVGVLYYYPYAQYNGDWYYLRPLATEGIENAYKETAIIVPFGFGGNFTFNRKIRLGVQFAYRFTNTDYLDDVSSDYAYSTELPYEESFIFANRSAEAYVRGNEDLPPIGIYKEGGRRGNPEGDDGYLFSQVSLSYVIASGSNFSKSRYRGSINRRRKRTKF